MSSSSLSIKTKIQPSTLLLTVNPSTKGRAAAGGGGGGGNVLSSLSEASYVIGIMDPLRPRIAIHSITRTISDIKPIMKKLSEISPDYELPEITFKMFGALEADFVEQQRSELEAYLNAIAQSKLLCYDVDYLAFVGFNAASKERMQRSYLLLQLNHSLTLNSCVGSLLNQAMAAPDEKAITVARCWLRGRDDLIFVRALPSLTHPKWPCRKTTILVEDTSKGQHILTVQNISPVSILAGHGGPEKVKRVKQMMQRMNPSVFAPLLDLDVVEDKMLAIRPLYPAGSLLDLIHDASSPLDKDKFSESGARSGGGVSSARLHQATKEVFRIVRACHAYGFSVPNLLAGNLLVQFGKGRGVDGRPPSPSTDLRVTLAGLEDVIAGNSWLPLQSVAPDSDHDMPTQTHVDVLLFGAVLYQLASGCVLSPEELEKMIGCQGEVFADDDDLTGDGIEIAPQYHVLGQKELASLNPEAANILHYVFHPTTPANERILQYHAFLRHHSTVIQTEEGALYAAPAEDESALSMKKKDLELILEQIAKWDDERDHKKVRREKYERECASIIGRDFGSTASQAGGVTALLEKRQHKKEREAQRKADAERAAMPPPAPAPAPPPPPPTVPVTMAPQPPPMPNFASASGLSLQPPPPVLMTQLTPPPSTDISTQSFGPYAPPPPPPRPVGIPPPPPKNLYNSDKDSDEGFEDL